MRRLLYTGGLTGLIYALLSVLIVGASALSGSAFSVLAVTYVGPTASFYALVWLNRSMFDDISNSAVRWVLLLGTCGVMTAAISFCVFVLSVNVHLALGGRI